MPIFYFVYALWERLTKRPAIIIMDDKVVCQHGCKRQEFLFADRTYEVEGRIYQKDAYDVYPASQKVRAEFLSGDGDPWFSRDGVSAHMELGLTSIGFDFGFDEIIPTFITMYADVQYSLSPKPFVALTASAAFAMDRYHKDGFGYVYPESFEISALDNAIRPRVRATPWRTEWWAALPWDRPVALLGPHARFRGKPGFATG